MRRAISKDRYGQAYVNLCCFRWDSLFGTAPDGWTKMTDREKFKLEAYQNAMKKLLNILSPREQSMYWWTLELEKTYSEWKRYWTRKQMIKEIAYKENAK